MQLEEFDLSKKYVFSKEKYIEDEKQDETLTKFEKYQFNKNIKKWVDDADGEEVILISEVLGTISMYKDVFISVNWCKEKQ